MATFESSSEQFKQEHFSVIEIDLPVVNGTCTISGLPGYGTPLSCDQSSNGIKTYKFTDYMGVLPESGIHKIVKSISDSPTELQLGTGLAKRGALSVTLIDKQDDPNPFAPAVTDTIRKNGTLLGKMNSRYVFTNNIGRRKDYIVEKDGSVDLVNGAKTSYFIIDTFTAGRNNLWTIKFKDELSKTNFGESVWPLAQEGYLRNAITDVQTTFDVDPNIDYKVNDTIRLADELCKITGISNIQTASAQITVQNRGNSIAYTNLLSKTSRDAHDAGDEIFLCEVADAERIDDLARRILIDVGIDTSIIPITDWNAEIDEWSLSLVNTLFIESMDTSEVLNKLLIPRQLNCWFDPIDREVKLTAINAWKESTFVIEEGITLEDNAIIDFDSVTIKKEENLRATRALITYTKPNLTDSEEFQSYRKASIAIRTELETTDFFGVEPKIKQFGFSSSTDKVTADLLTSRYVQRNSDPYSLTWITQESKKNFKVGDVGDIKTNSVLDFNGLTSTSSRGQVISVKPVNTSFGREYKCKALVYEPALSDGTEIILSGNISGLNLFIRAGAPSEAVNITFIFANAIVGSPDNNVPSIIAGNFPVGSKIIIIMVDGTYMLSKGGDGGDGGVAIFDEELQIWRLLPQPSNGSNGGICYDAQGIDSDIYFSGATPSVNYPIADGSIFAPSGGDGGFDAITSTPIGGNGGKGGDGSSFGVGGLAGYALIESSGDTFNGVNGLNGTDNPLTGIFGQAGANNNALGGLSGSGVVDNGATVNFFGDTPSRYINGNGSH